MVKKKARLLDEARNLSPIKRENWFSRLPDELQSELNELKANKDELLKNITKAALHRLVADRGIEVSPTGFLLWLRRKE